jgi:hypothetical protein
VSRGAGTRSLLLTLLATVLIVVQMASCTPAQLSGGLPDAGRDARVDHGRDARVDHTLGPFHFDGSATIDGHSPGTVTLELATDPSTTFCDHRTLCDVVEHITILTAAGQPLGWAVDMCAPGPCSAPCLPTLCPTLACFQDDQAFTGEQMVWDGSYQEELSCSSFACLRSRFAPPGHYLAQMCATAGTFVPGDASPSNALCTPTGHPQCVTVGFDFPGTVPIVGELPAAPND